MIVILDGPSRPPTPTVDNETLAWQMLCKVASIAPELMTPEALNAAMEAAKEDESDGG